MTTTNIFDKCIKFSKFSATYGIEPYQLAELLELANKAAKEGVKEANGKRNKYTQARTNFEQKAQSLHFEVEWNCVWPDLKCNGNAVWLPQIQVNYILEINPEDTI